MIIALNRGLFLALVGLLLAVTSMALANVSTAFIFPFLFGEPITQSLSPLGVPSNPNAIPSALYSWSPYIAVAGWAIFGLAMWKGQVRKSWQMQGYDYDAFKVFAKMKGSKTRLKILQSLQMPKNRLQIAKELDMHWESIDNHIDILVKYGLVEELASFGTAKYLIITWKGKELAALLEKDDELVDN